MVDAPLAQRWRPATPTLVAVPRRRLSVIHTPTAGGRARRYLRRVATAR